MEKSINEMTGQELRDALAEYERTTRPAAPAAPLAPGMAATDSEKNRDTAGQLFAESIMRKPSGQWTADERAFMRASVAQTLREMGN